MVLQVCAFPGLFVGETFLDSFGTDRQTGQDPCCCRHPPPDESRVQITHS